MKKRKANKSNLKRIFTVISISGFCLFVAVANLLQFNFMDDVFLLAERIIMKEIANEITELDFTDETYKSTLSDIEANHNVYIEIYAPRDELIYTTKSNETVYEPDSIKTEENVLKPRIMRFLSRIDVNDDGSYFELREEYYATAQYIVYGAFFSENSGLEIYSSVDVLKENAVTASWALFAMSIFLTVFISLIAMAYMTIITKPLSIINKTTKKIAHMDFSETCPAFKVKELDELSGNINILSSSLNKALDTLKSENIQLERDIEREKRLEKVMRSFMANVSHELKTPISIIQGYAEGMKYGIGCDSTEEFCNIIIDESEKMNNLVVRLMEYLQYGSETYKVNMCTFNISELIRDNLDIRMPKIEEARAILKADINESFYGYGDTELLSNIFNNYLSNALSHLDFEREIIITAKDNGDRYTVSVFNSGKQIPGTDIENIWQSFYRADKAHSRSEGRFGLGLSIVAVLQKLHEQKYGVINHEKGVEFWFDIKKADKQ